MAQQRVFPGEVIRSEVFNDLLNRLEAIEGRLGSVAGTPTGVVVPGVIGGTLANARSKIAQATLSVGAIYDAFGSAISATLSGAQSLRVLNQDPVPGARAATGSAVLLVVAAKLEEAGTTTRPEIEKIDKKVPIFGMMSIQGRNFREDLDDYEVTFDSAVGLPLFIRGPQLFVRVPEITSAPRNVDVVVETPRGRSDAEKVQILPVPGKVPQIDEVELSNTFVRTAQITGKNFNSDPDKNLVVYSGVVIKVKSVKQGKVLELDLSELKIDGTARRRVLRGSLVVVTEIGDEFICSEPYKERRGGLDFFHR